jgi:uncharacterized protein YuzE
MIKVNPLSGEDRAKILDYCEGHKAQVVNERDVDDCVVIDMDRNSIQGAALITGFKTNAQAKFKDMSLKENILLSLLALQESASVMKAVEALTVEQVISKADYCAGGDDLTPLYKGKEQKVEEVTTDDHGDTVVVISAVYRSNTWMGHVTFNNKLDAIEVTVVKDKMRFKR